ncbi:hypothetical protein BT96DRAFT_595518 [Gymnopus androsaceus JB14]|uniref:Uncharacterized protein n=1 Tax=Gymnopus androsaceus JB14 TaxID=1447944 RepID=A0A6A4GIN6_9AGAR|nr:hypothetical protein BT96DRAFT_595518 [Gymnopus androsaceus JB14]
MFTRSTVILKKSSMRPNIQLFPSPDIPIPLAPISAAAPSSAVYYSPTGLLSPARHCSSYCCLWTTVSCNRPASWSSHVPPGTGLVAAPAHISMPASEGSLPAPFNVPSKVSTLIPTPLETTMQKSCSICLRKPPTLTCLAILAHYGHALCSSCSTSALNIADEKDMECAGCQGKVANLKLVFITADEGGSAKLTTATASTTFSQLQVGVFDIMLSTPDGNHSFDFGSMDELDFFSDGGIQASTPLSKAKGMRRASSLAVDVDKKEGRGAIVLRIDDIPWVCPSPFKLWMLY